MIEFVIPGRPKGKGRPRFTKRGTTFTPKDTKLAEADIVAAWEAVGSPTLHDGPVAVGVALEVPRPKSHHLSGGLLSATGILMPWPHRQKPDVDNALKLIMDAMNGRAYKDDVRVVQATVSRTWCRPELGSRSIVVMWEVGE